MNKKTTGIIIASVAVGAAAGYVAYRHKDEIKKFALDVLDNILPEDEYDDEEIHLTHLDNIDKINVEDEEADEDDEHLEGMAFDTTGDGKVDTVLVDTTKDGNADTAFVDTDGDGQADEVVDLTK